MSHGGLRLLIGIFDARPIKVAINVSAADPVERLRAEQVAAP